MKLSICDLCETVVRPGEYHRLGEPIQVAQMEISKRKYLLMVNTIDVTPVPDYGGSNSGFRPQVEPVDLCFKCIQKELEHAVAAYGRPPAQLMKPLDNPDL